ERLEVALVGVRVAPLLPVEGLDLRAELLVVRDGVLEGAHRLDEEPLARREEQAHRVHEMRRGRVPPEPVARDVREAAAEGARSEGPVRGSVHDRPIHSPMARSRMARARATRTLGPNSWSTESTSWRRRREPRSATCARTRSGG